MEINIRLAKKEDLPQLIDLCLQAFKPIFDSFEKVLGPEIYPIIYPDWRRAQTQVVMDEIDNEDIIVWVGEVGDEVAGLVTQKLDQKSRIGEVHFLAVNPIFQNRGLGTALNRHVLDQLRDAGMTVAMVSTGGDISHAPARHTYEKVGFIPLPIVNYYKKL